MSNRERKMTQVDVGGLSLDGFTLPEIVKQLEKLIEQHGADAEVSMERSPWSDSDERHPRIMARRIETDEEFRERIRHEDELAARIEAHNRREFQRLSALYGNDVKKD